MVHYENWKVIDYSQAWRQQISLFTSIIQAKQRKDAYLNKIVFCQHPHVYTLGKSGKDNNLLISPEQLSKINATFFHIDRGGDITYHGPGQLVCYPILNMEEFHLGVKEYVHLLEEAIIGVCATYGIAASRIKEATGVWLDVGTPQARKICAIGVRCSHFVTMHGLALNVNTDLRYFDYINPCGYTDKGVTSLNKELGREVDIEEVRERLQQKLTELGLS